MDTFRLRNLGLGARLGLICLCITVLGGLAASVQHLVYHHENRDEKPGVSVEDITGAYHGVQTTAPLAVSLARGHPETLPQPKRQAIMDWLTGPNLAANYDNLDLGDNAPVEIVAQHCLSCHGRANAEKNAIAKTVPLDNWGDFKTLTVSRKVEPTPLKILAASTHTHALALASLGFIGAGMLLATSWPRWLVGLTIFVTGFGLAADIAAWWLARDYEWMVSVVIGAGAAFNGAVAVSMLLVIVDLCLPKKP
jgi:hypothetical protein